MHCPICNAHFENGKFCPDCGEPLVEDVATNAAGIGLNMGDANAISGGVHLADSHNVSNVDQRVINTSTVSNVTNNITQLEHQKTETEILQERKIQFMALCKEVYADGILAEHEKAMLEMKRIELNLDESTAAQLIETARRSMNSRMTALTVKDSMTMKLINKLVVENKADLVKAQLPRLEAMAKMYIVDEVLYNYNMLLAALNPDKLIQQYEGQPTDEYWQTFWVCLAYLKQHNIEKFEEASLRLNLYPNYSENNDLILQAISICHDFGADSDTAQEVMSIIDVNSCSPELKSVFYALYLMAKPAMAEEVNADPKACAFLMENIIGLELPEARAERLAKEKDKQDKSSKIVATDDTVFQIVRDEIKRLGNNADLNHIDVSRCTTFYYKDKRKGLFEETDFQGDVSEWDVSNVKDMRLLFYRCEKFNCDLSNWDVSSVEDMRKMFLRCNDFEGKGLDKWDVSSVKDMHRMFFRCGNFNCDLSKWDVSSVENMESMFLRCNNFEGKGLDKWDVSSVKNMDSMFFRCEIFNGDLSRWDVSNVKVMTDMFLGCGKINCDMSNWNVSNVEDHQCMFLECKLDESKWPVFYKKKQNLQSKIVATDDTLFQIVRDEIKRLGNNADLNHIDVSRCTTFYDKDKKKGLFQETDFQGDISEWDVSKVRNMRALFWKSKFNGDISKWNVSNVTDIWCMFAESKFRGDLSKWDVSKVTNMVCLFYKAKFNGDISKWDVGNVTDMNGLFGCSNFNRDISKWNVCNVEDMGNMFCGLLLFRNVFDGDISKWNVSKVRNMKNMFYNSKFDGDISKWDVSNVENMNSMFMCSEFNGDMSRWDVSKVTDMENMFYMSFFNGDISKWDVSNVKNHKDMFDKCDLDENKKPKFND